MNAIHRRGACPALAAPMLTGDGLLVRLNTVAGGFSPSQLIRLCEAAARHGNGIVEVTARGSFQIRGLTQASAPMLAAEVDALGIAVRTGVPVETGPLAGLDPDEVADPAPLAAAIRAAISRTGLAARLGPKVSVVVDGGGCSGMDGIAADIRLTAERADDAGSGPNMWRLALAGNAAHARPVARLEGDERACAGVLALLDQIAELGIEARARDLSPPVIAQALCAISNLRSNEPSSVLAEGGPLDDVAGATNEPAVSARIDPDRPGHALFTPLRLTDARNAIAVALPFGSSDAASLVELARAAERLAIAEIRLSPGRRLIFIAASQATCRALRRQAAKLGFITGADDPRLSISACPGTPACASGHLASRAIALALAKSAGDALDGSLALHVSGCAKGCANPGRADLTIVGGEKGAGLVVGGTTASHPVAYASQAEAARQVGAVLALVGTSRRAGESSASCAARLGADHFAKAFVRA